jgi:hypothetical protein
MTGAGAGAGLGLTMEKSGDFSRILFLIGGAGFGIFVAEKKLIIKNIVLFKFDKGLIRKNLSNRKLRIKDSSVSSMPPE